MKTKAYMNGVIIDEDRACVSILDRGLNYGDGVFETIKAVDGVPIFLARHMERLKNGARSIGMSARTLGPLMADIKAGAIERLLRSNRLNSGSAYIRVTVTRGIDAGGHLPQACTQPTAIIRTKPLDEKAIQARQTKGISAVLLRSHIPAIPSVKTLNYLPNVLGRYEAAKRGADEGIFTDGRNRVSEGTSSNLFMVALGVIKTPPVQGAGLNGVLPGVTRGYVLELAASKGLKARETGFTADKLAVCDEAFLTNSISGIVPLIKVDGISIGSGRPGPVTTALQEVYNALVREASQER